MGYSSTKDVEVLKDNSPKLYTVFRKKHPLTFSFISP